MLIEFEHFLMKSGLLRIISFTKDDIVKFGKNERMDESYIKRRLTRMVERVINDLNDLSKSNPSNSVKIEEKIHESKLLLRKIDQFGPGTKEEERNYLFNILISYLVQTLNIVFVILGLKVFSSKFLSDVTFKDFFGTTGSFLVVAILIATLGVAIHYGTKFMRGIIDKRELAKVVKKANDEAEERITMIKKLRDRAEMDVVD